MSAFETHVRQQVRAFLQTIVMIDDEADDPVVWTAGDVGNGDPTVSPDPQVGIDPSDVVPGGDGENQWESTGAVSGPVLVAQAPVVERAENPLDARATTTAFATAGLCCTILSPRDQAENQSLTDPFLSAARRADVVVLDWNLNRDQGATALSIVAGILERDAKPVRRRLRLIAVYTGEPDLLNIADRLHTQAEVSLPDDETEWGPGPGRVAFTRGPVRVSVFAKPGGSLPADLRDRARTVKELPKTVIEEFASLSLGLVTTAALAALTGIRDDAHRILAVLEPGLDPAFLAQRLGMEEPAESETQVEILIASELMAVIQDHQIGKNVGLSVAGKWLRHHRGALGNGALANDEWYTVTNITTLLRRGLGGKDKVKDLQLELTSAPSLKKLAQKPGELFSAQEEQRLRSMALLHERMSIRSRYDRPRPIMQLGTIVEFGGSYFMCVLPLCDSVRLKGKVTIPLHILTELLPGTQPKSGSLMVGVADPRRPEGVRLEFKADTTALRMVSFSAHHTGVVLSRTRRGVREFSAPKARPYRWIADVRAEYAQNAAEMLGHQFARVGLDQPETLRQNRA